MQRQRFLRSYRWVNRSRLLFLSLMLGIGLLARPVQAATISVTNTNDSGPGSLRQAIANAVAGDTVSFNLAGCPCTLTLTSGELVINKNLTITGPGAKVLTVSGNNVSRIFRIAAGTFTVTISDLTVANGATAGAGGAIRVEGNGVFTLRNAIVKNSKLTATSGAGGGLEFRSSAGGGNLTIERSTFTGNSAPEGGAIHLQSGNVTIRNTTISGNTATGPHGGGIANYQSNLTILNTTITGNSAVKTATEESSGGVRNHSTTNITVANSIIAGNSGSNPDVGDYAGATGTFISLGNNLIGNNVGALTYFPAGKPNAKGDLVGASAAPVNPLLAALTDNGGPTPTHALQAGSPALNAGNAAAPTGVSPACEPTDQRGVTRPNRCDIGAFELDATAVDSTAPAANPTHSPPPAPSGWNNTNVTVTWNWTDSGGSGIDPANCTASSVSSGSARVTVTATCKDLAGNTGTATYQAMVDPTAPNANPSQSPVANATGWNNSDVTVNWNWWFTGAIIDTANCTTSSVSSGEGALTLSAICKDVALNQRTATYPVKVDKTAPVVAVTDVTAGGSYTLGSVPTVACSTTDALAGVATNATLSVTGGNGDGTGNFTATCSGATDLAGNSAVAISVGYTVAAPTATPTNTPLPTATPTNTPIPPTATSTNTPLPPTATSTDTPVPPTATSTNTPLPTATPTNTPIPPTATATNTPLPPTATPTEAPGVVTFNGFADISRLTLNGWAQKFSNSLRLVPDAAPSLVGSAYLTTPSPVTSFQTRFSFSFSPFYDNRSGGMAFVIQNASVQALGDSFNLGYSGIRPSVAVFLTRTSDPSCGDRVGIVVNGEVINRCSSGVASPVSLLGTVNVWVDYDEPSTTLQVFVGGYPGTPLLTRKIDLKATIGATAFVGFTASTPPLNDWAGVDLLYWQWVVTMPPTATPTNTPPPTAMSTATVALPTVTPTNTPLPPTATPALPTATPTNTALPPTATPALPTATPTNTALPPTATPTAVPVSVTFNGFADISRLTLNGWAQKFTNNILRLVPDAAPSLVGSAYLTTPSPVTSFQTHFRFTFSPFYDNRSGGMAFVIQNASVQALGYSDFNLGYTGIKPSVAVFLTRSSDPSCGNRVGIAVNGEVINSCRNGVASPVSFLDTVNVWVDYDEPSTTLKVFVGGYPGTPLLTRKIDLKATIGATAFVGFTASTPPSDWAGVDLLYWQWVADSTLSLITPTTTPVVAAGGVVAGAAVSADTGTAAPTQPLTTTEVAAVPVVVESTAPDTVGQSQRLFLPLVANNGTLAASDAATGASVSEAGSQSAATLTQPVTTTTAAAVITTSAPVSAPAVVDAAPVVTASASVSVPATVTTPVVADTPAITVTQPLTPTDAGAVAGDANAAAPDTTAPDTAGQNQQIFLPVVTNLAGAALGSPGAVAGVVVIVLVVGGLVWRRRSRNR